MKAPDGVGSGDVCMVNIIELQAMVKSLTHAAPQIRASKTQCTDRLDDVLLSATKLSQTSAIAAWVDDQIVMSRRMLAYARRVAEQDFAGMSHGDPRHPPAIPSTVSFDERGVPHTPPALARKQGREAAALLTKLRTGDAKPTAADVQALNDLMLDGSVDPYFAAAFAKATTPADYQEFIRGIYPDSPTRIDGRAHAPADGIDQGAYATATGFLAQTLSLATRGTGDLALPGSWNRTFVKAMLDPGTPEHPASQRDVENTSSLLLLMSKGDWSTPFLDLVGPSIAHDVHTGQRGWGARAGLGWMARDDNNRPYGDQAAAYLTALARNPQAAEHAFSKGPTTSMPFPEDKPKGSGQVNAFMYDLLTAHIFQDDTNPHLVTDAINAGVLWNAHGGTATSAAVFTKSATQSQQVWDKKSPWEKYHHIVLGALSFLPYVGPAFAAIDSGFYLAEGDLGAAAFALTPGKATNEFRALSSGMRLAAQGGRVAEEAEAASWAHLSTVATDTNWLTKADGLNTKPNSVKFYTEYTTATPERRALIDGLSDHDRKYLIEQVNAGNVKLSYKPDGHIWSAISEAKGYDTTVHQSHTEVLCGLKNISTQGPDFVTLNNKTGEVTVWDPKFRSTLKRRYPQKIYDTGITAKQKADWTPQIEEAIRNYPGTVGALLRRRLFRPDGSLDISKIDWKLVPFDEKGEIPAVNGKLQR